MLLKLIISRHPSCHNLSYCNFQEFIAIAKEQLLVYCELIFNRISYIYLQQLVASYSSYAYTCAISSYVTIYNHSIHKYIASQLAIYCVCMHIVWWVNDSVSVIYTIAGTVATCYSYSYSQQCHHIQATACMHMHIATGSSLDMLEQIASQLYSIP